MIMSMGPSLEIQEKLGRGADVSMCVKLNIIKHVNARKHDKSHHI